MPDMTFTKYDLRGVMSPHSDTLVLKVDINKQDVYRVLLDRGDFVNVLYKHTFDRLVLNTNIEMQMATPIIGFSRETVHPKWSI